MRRPYRLLYLLDHAGLTKYPAVEGRRGHISHEN